MQHSWDYIVVGAGSAGCVVAARLAEDPALRVLLLDAGDNRRSLLMAVPAGVRFLIGNPRYDWRYASEPDASLASRKIAWSAGNVVGGGSAINGMVFSRGLARDYDDWASLGCEGWSAAEVAPVFASLERFAGAGGEGRGRCGPQAVEFNRYRSAIMQPYLAACAQAGVPVIADVNAFPFEGIGHAQTSTANGRRCSTRDAYLSRHRNNLELRSGARATQLVLENGRCRGVHYRHGGALLTARATREVVLCAGTFGSPQLLMLSGIGEPAMLKANGIDVRQSLPAVGDNLQDHAGIGVSLGVSASTISRRDQQPLRMAAHALRWLLRRDGVAAGAAMIACGYARSAAELPQPDLYLQLAAFGMESNATGSLQMSQDAAITSFCSVSQPRARGRLEPVSADPAQPLRGKLELLGDERDRQRLLAGVRLLRRIHAAPALRTLSRGERLPGDAVRSDEELLAFMRANAGSQYHPVGTCRMGGDPASVVDPQLRVRGLRGLRVADASIMPQLTSANTNAPTIMIAERAARWLREALRQPLP